MTTKRGILLVAAFLRLTNLSWDMNTHIHPDERFLTMVSDAMKLPKSLGEFFDSTKSKMSPYNNNYNFFVYGTLPLFIGGKSLGGRMASHIAAARDVGETAAGGNAWENVRP